MFKYFWPGSVLPLILGNQISVLKRCKSIFDCMVNIILSGTVLLHMCNNIILV